MKRYLVVGLLLSSCSILGGNTGRNVALQVGSTVEVRNLTSTTLDQNTLALTGKDNTFKVTTAGCKITDAALNIWGCRLGPIEPNKTAVVAFEGTLLSGNLFSYEQGTNKFLPTIVVTSR